MPASFPDRGAEAGYNLVILLVAVTVLNVLVAAMLPLWSTAIRREKEEELIFRGFQYAEAIRVYRMRHGGNYPIKLEQLIETKPRCIRQLWKDPMTEDGKWALIFQNQPSPPVQPQEPGRPGEPAGEKGEPSTGEEETDPEGRPQFGPGKGEKVEIGPIIGVRSKSGEDSMLVLFGRARYDEWHFTESVLLGGQRQAVPGIPGVGNPGQEVGGMQFSTRWLGRPMRFVDQHPAAPQDGTMPDGSTPNSRKGQAGRAGRSAKPN
jgi:type II secretory pathway pseudopilin PulG